MCGHRRSTRSTEQRAERRDPGMRASDADRERTADVLRHHGGLGRLDADELEERLEAALSAKPLGDLDALTADLPRDESAEPDREPFSIPFSPLVVVIAALVAISVLVGHPMFWLFFLLFFAHWRPWPAPHRR